MTTDNNNPLHIYQEQHVEESDSHDSGATTLRSRKVITTTVTSATVTTFSSTSASSTAPSKSAKLAGLGLYKTLGRLQAFSGIGLATFVAVHVVSPILAVAGGMESANNAMLWGRVFYQNRMVEIGLIIGSFAIHLLAGSLRAMLRTYWKTKRTSRSVAIPGEEGSTNTSATSASDASVTSTKQPASPPFFGSLFSVKAPGAGLYEWQRWSGWLLIPFLLVHVGMYRLLPIVIYGDSSLIDYSLVTWMFREGNQAVHYFGMVPLILLGLYHGTGGLFVAIDRSLLPRGWRWSTKKLKNLNWYQSAIAWIVAPLVLIGLWRIVEAPGPIPMAKYYQKLWELPE
ncbi:hypothetical protein BGW41_000077 [Actinomortierella wolfii]|nr:hypothetical protein BGW41_000077 [Actinomortierella wolfii]